MVRVDKCRCLFDIELLENHDRFPRTSITERCPYRYFCRFGDDGRKANLRNRKTTLANNVVVPLLPEKNKDCPDLVLWPTPLASQNAAITCIPPMKLHNLMIAYFIRFFGLDFRPHVTFTEPRCICAIRETAVRVHHVRMMQVRVPTSTASTKKYH